MMQHSGSSSRARRGLVDDSVDGSSSERAVFYDLDAGSRRSAMQLAAARPKAEPTASKSHTTTVTKGSAPKRGAASRTAAGAAAPSTSAVLHRPKEIFKPASLLQLGALCAWTIVIYCCCCSCDVTSRLRIDMPSSHTQRALLYLRSLDALSDGHGSDDDDDANPFASLLQPRTQPQPQQHHDDSAVTVDGVSDVDDHDDDGELVSSGSSQPIAATKRTTSSLERPRSSVAVSRLSTAHSPFIRTRIASAKTAKTATHATVEAADARPSRWSQRSSVSTTSHRRASGTKRSGRTAASAVRRCVCYRRGVST